MKIWLEKSLGLYAWKQNICFVFFLREINLKVLRFLFILFNFVFGNNLEKPGI